MDLREVGGVGNDQFSPSSLERRTADKLGKTQKPAKIQKRASTDKRCTSCGTTSTPVWRWGGETKEVLLCNACSLRIRRSATRPQRAKSPNDLSSQKQSPHLASGDSGSPRGSGAVGELAPADAEALRVELLRCVEFHLGLEKARLLGPRDALVAAEPWQSSQHRDTFQSASTPMHSTAQNQLGQSYEAQLRPGLQQYNMSESLHIDSGRPHPASDTRHVHLI